MNEKINAIRSDAQKDNKPQNKGLLELQMDLQRQYVIDAMQEEHSESWWRVMYAFVSHYKEA